MMRKFLFTVLLVFSLLSSSAVLAANLWGTDAYTDTVSVISDSRSVGGGLVGAGTWTDVTLSWEIMPMLMGNTVYWQYTYTIDTSNVMTAKAVSHFILEVSNPDFTLMSDYGDDDFPLEGPQDWTSSGGITLPNGFFGIKFDFGGSDNETVYTFKSPNSPVYGNFWAKGGSPNELYNVALGVADYDDPTNMNALLMDEMNFIVRPNGVVPLPSAVWFFGSALIGLVGLRKMQASS
jgi:hypothetical protein